jgi:replicative DNA helicase
MKDTAEGPVYGLIEAEQQLLGAILLDNGCYDRISDILKPEHFADPLHGHIFDICARRIAAGHLVSPVALRPILETHEGLAQVGGWRYLARIAGASISGSLSRSYAEIIIEQACRRALYGGAQEALKALEVGQDSGEVRTRLLEAVSRLPEPAGSESTMGIAKAVMVAVNRAVQAYQGEASYLQTGVPGMDRIVRGLAPGNMTILGGATSMGKTSLALEIAANVSMKQGKGVAFVSLEMAEEELATRMASSIARVPYSDIRDASSMEEDAFRKWIEASKQVGDAKLRIVPKHVRDVAAIHAAVRRADREMGGLSLVIVDYAQLIQGKGNSRYEQMTNVSIGLKLMAGMIGVPVIALVQLGRDLQVREDKRPQLSDIKETGQYENDADQVIFCHREAYYLERHGPNVGKNGEISAEARADWEADLARTRNIMELIVRKNRHGRLASAEVGFHAATNRFWEIGRE